MKKKKLEVSKELKLHLEKMDAVLSDFALDDEGLSHVVAGGGCGGLCKITCAYYCRPACEGTCKGSCEFSCTISCSIGHASQDCPSWVVLII